MNEAAYQTLVDAVHHLMKLERWKTASALNVMAIRMCINPRLEIELYYKAMEIMKTDSDLAEYYNRMYNILEGNTP